MAKRVWAWELGNAVGSLWHRTRRTYSGSAYTLCDRSIEVYAFVADERFTGVLEDFPDGRECVACVRITKMETVLQGVLPFLLDDPTARYDALAERFLADTGIMAPGKDAPEPLLQPPGDVRAAAYSDWLRKELRRLKTLCEQALVREALGDKNA